MSSDTARSTSRSGDPAFLMIACAGFCSAALQTVFFRELLSVFSGNELSIGIIFSVWLLATGASTARAAARNPARQDALRDPVNFPLFISLLCVSSVFGFFAIRLSRLAFGGGLALGPLAILAVVAVSVVPFTIVNGYFLGALFSSGARFRKSYGALYGAENVGAGAGALVVFLLILLYSQNSTLAAVSMAPFLFFTGKQPWAAAVVCGSIAILVIFDHSSLQWKYSTTVSRVIYGREGEIVPVTTGADTTFLVNGTVYKSTMEKPFLEQAVHIPMAQRANAARALVIFDRGHKQELEKYPGLAVDNIETEPALATGAARVTAVESYRPAHPYDVIFLGTGIPRTAASNRFYTRSFFLKTKSLLSDSGLLSFSLPFSENYLGRSEQRLYDALMSTLLSTWKNVVVFPGEGYTFMASDGPLVAMPPQIHVATEYLASAIIPGVTEERIQSANKRPAHPAINTQDRPVTLLLGLQTWLDLFKGSMWLLVALFAVCCVAVAIVLCKTRDSLSVGSSGFATGIYSVSLLLLYQATFGALYSRVSLLLVCLTAGFVIGSFCKKFPLSDFFIGLYAVVSLCILAMLPFPPAFLFYLFHAGIGVLAGAQFVTRKARIATAPASLYAADMLGGAIGMAVCSTMLVPLFGIVPVGAGLFVLKAGVEAGMFYIYQRDS